MRDEFLPFSRPSISEKEIADVADVLRSGWITTGPKATELEEAFKEYCDAEKAVALSSATGGMHLLLAAFFAITIIGFPIAVQHIKLVKVALLPFGHVMREVGD